MSTILTEMRWCDEVCWVTLLPSCVNVYKGLTVWFKRLEESELPFNYLHFDCDRWNVVNGLNAFWCLEFDGSLLECP